ncbi:MgtC/SapB family protein [Paenibacillus larvae]
MQVVQFDMILRLLLAGVFGAMIGFERKSRLKEAGLRTHFLVAVGSALIMVVSKYGFFDVLHVDGVELDASRVAAQVVSGIGFLGAGTIIVQRQAVRGLTTSAGLWATSGIGLTVGAGLY